MVHARLNDTEVDGVHLHETFVVVEVDGCLGECVVLGRSDGCACFFSGKVVVVECGFLCGLSHHPNEFCDHVVEGESLFDGGLTRRDGYVFGLHLFDEEPV